MVSFPSRGTTCLIFKRSFRINKLRIQSSHVFGHALIAAVSMDCRRIFRLDCKDGLFFFVS